MSLTISASTFKYGDSPFLASFSGWGGSFVPIWSVDNATISGDRTNSLTITPLNRTSTSNVVVFRGKYWASNSTISPEMSFVGNNLVKASGAGFTSAYVSATPTTFYDGVDDITVLVQGDFYTNSTDTAIGFNDENNNTGMKCFWYVSGTTAYVKVNSGSMLDSNSNEVTTTIEDGDRLSIKLINGKQAKFYKNNQFIAEYYFYPIFTSGYIIARLSTGGANTRINAPTFYINDSSESTTYQAYCVLPVQPNYPYDGIPDDLSVISYAEDKTSVALIKRGKGTKNLTFNNRPKAEFDLINAIWEFHDKGIPFYFPDLVLGVTELVKFDSFRYTIVRSNVFTFNAVIRKA